MNQFYYFQLHDHTVNQFHSGYYRGYLTDIPSMEDFLSRSTIDEDTEELFRQWQENPTDEIRATYCYGTPPFFTPVEVLHRVTLPLSRTVYQAEAVLRFPLCQATFRFDGGEADFIYVKSDEGDICRYVKLQVLNPWMLRERQLEIWFFRKHRHLSPRRRKKLMKKTRLLKFGYPIREDDDPFYQSGLLKSEDGITMGTTLWIAERHFQPDQLEEEMANPSPLDTSILYFPVYPQIGYIDRKWYRKYRDYEADKIIEADGSDI